MQIASDSLWGVWGGSAGCGWLKGSHRVLMLQKQNFLCPRSLTGPFTVLAVGKNLLGLFRLRL